MKHLLSVLILVLVAFMGVQPKKVEASNIIPILILNDKNTINKIDSLIVFYIENNKINDFDSFVNDYMKITRNIDWRPRFYAEPTLLQWAVTNNKLEWAKILLEKGANPNLLIRERVDGKIFYRSDKTALDVALANNNQEMADILVSAGGKTAVNLK